MLDGQIQTCNRSELQILKQGVLSDSRPQRCEDGRSEKLPVEIPFKNSPESGAKNDCLTPLKNGHSVPPEKGGKSLLVGCVCSTIILEIRGTFFFYNNKLD